MLQELAVVAEKLKYLEERNYRMAVGTSFKPANMDDIAIPSLDFSNAEKSRSSAERDVHLHEAGLIREQRLSVLKKFQEEIKNMGSRVN